MVTSSSCASFVYLRTVLNERKLEICFINCECDKRLIYSFRAASHASEVLLQIIYFFFSLQLYLNGTSYGGWFSPQCRGLVISGLIGGKAYHVVLVAFSAHDSFEPQLSNEVVCANVAMRFF